jgi:hypothetical protein
MPGTHLESECHTAEMMEAINEPVSEPESGEQSK